MSNEGRRIIISIQDKSGILISEKIEWKGRPSKAIVETIKKVLKYAATNNYITMGDLFHLISYCALLNIPENDTKKRKAIEKELNEWRESAQQDQKQSGQTQEK